MGRGGGGLTQTSPTDNEGLGYNPPNRFVRSFAPLIPQPSCAKPRHDANQPCDDPPIHSFSIGSNPTIYPPTLASRERCSSPHTETCNPHTHIPLGTVNHRTQDTGLSLQGTTASIDEGPHRMHEPSPLSSVCSHSPVCHFHVTSDTVKATISVPNLPVNFLETPATSCYRALRNNPNIAVSDVCSVHKINNEPLLQIKSVEPPLVV